MKRFLSTLFILILALALVITWNIYNGSSSINSMNVDRETYLKVIYDIRLPRIIAAILLGGALAVSGFLLQTFFGNPIAGPYVLGISSGAKLTVAIAMIFLLERGIHLSSIGMVLFAFIGSMLAMIFVLLISTQVQKMSMLIVCGILIGYICSAITDLLVTFANDSNIVNLHNWSLGSFSGIGWNHIPVMTIIVIFSLIAVFLLSKPIGAYMMGENYARNMGVNITSLRVLLILFSSLLSACVTAFAGPISFVGIAVPHLVKIVLKSAKPIIVIPVAFLMGSLVTLFCDGIARTVFAPTEISISTITAVLLVPVVIAMMINRQAEKSET